jgi:uncharacterized membrane protein YphA (DoxX/SURF4 family)
VHIGQTSSAVQRVMPALHACTALHEAVGCFCLLAGFLTKAKCCCFHISLHTRGSTIAVLVVCLAVAHASCVVCCIT